jgi:hypothetical protein
VQRLTNPRPVYVDARGGLLTGGRIYIGEAGQDPQDSPIPVYWDADGTQIAPQPLRTLGGLIVNGETPAFVYFDAEDWSYRVLDSDGSLIDNILSAADAGGASIGSDYQPLDEDLTAIAALATTAYGRALLTLANQAALREAVDISPGIPTTGGTVTGNILRSGAGVHPYFANSGMTGGRIFITSAGDPDPTSQPGDIWLTYTP